MFGYHFAHALSFSASAGFGGWGRGGFCRGGGTGGWDGVSSLVEMVWRGKERYLDDLRGEHGGGYIFNGYGAEL